MNAQRRVALLIVGGVALAAFVVLAALVAADADGVVRVDRSWHESLRGFGLDHPGWLATMRAITHLGDTVTVLVVDLILFAVCLRQRRLRLAVAVAVLGLGGWAARILVRDLVARPRPVDPLWPAEGWSFPSGHTTNATLMFILVVAVVWPLIGRGARWLLLVGAAGGALAVGLSRVAGGVHWPSDVLGGWTLAVALGCLVGAALGWPRRGAATS